MSYTSRKVYNYKSQYISLLKQKSTFPSVGLLLVLYFYSMKTNTKYFFSSSKLTASGTVRRANQWWDHMWIFSHNEAGHEQPEIRAELRLNLLFMWLIAGDLNIFYLSKFYPTCCTKLTYLRDHMNIDKVLSLLQSKIFDIWL